MSRTPLIILLFVLTVSLWGYQFIGEDFTLPGRIYCMLLLAEPGEMVGENSLILSNEEGETLSSTQFFPYPLDGYDNLWVALLGVGATVESGRQILDAQVEMGNRQVYFRKRLMVSQREFPNQVVELNRTLTSLRSEPNPQKTREYRQRWAQISYFGPLAMYHQSPITSPLRDDYITTTQYGARRTYHYDDGTESSTLHWGLDWASPLGTPIYSAAAGQVRLAQEMIVTGNTLIIEHLPGVYTVYYHLDSINVQENQLVETGHPLGTMGESGLATGSHLHWEIRVSKTAVDPLYYLDHPLLDKQWIMSKLNDTTL